MQVYVCMFVTLIPQYVSVSVPVIRHRLGASAAGPGYSAYGFAGLDGEYVCIRCVPLRHRVPGDVLRGQGRKPGGGAQEGALAQNHVQVGRRPAPGPAYHADDRAHGFPVEKGDSLHTNPNRSSYVTELLSCFLV